MSEDLKNRIRQRLAELGLTPEGASKKAGLSRAFLRQLFVRSSSPRTDSLVALADALETTPRWLLEGQGPKAVEPSVLREQRSTWQSEVKLADVDMPFRDEMTRDVPVLGTAAGSAEGEFQFEGGVIDYVRRPPALASARDIYTIYVVGYSMEPRFTQGDLCFINPHKPARIGDSVVVQLRQHDHEPIQALIGQLARRTSNSIVIGKLNPPAEVPLPVQTVLHIHKVLDMNELFGM